MKRKHDMKYAHDSTYKKALPLRLTKKTECIDLRFQFLKFRLVRCFTLSFYSTGLCIARLMKKATD